MNIIVVEVAVAFLMFQHANYDLTDLSSWLRRRGKFDTATSRVIVCEAASTILYVQRLQCVLRNLKTESILLSAAGHIRIHDFEFVKRLENQRSMTIIGYFQNKYEDR